MRPYNASSVKFCIEEAPFPCYSHTQQPNGGQEAMKHLSSIHATVLAIVLAASAALAQAPASFTADITNGASVVTVDFVQHPIRSANYIVYLQDATGAFNPVTPPESRTYIGTVRDNPGALAAGTLKPDGTLLARVSFDTGVEWNKTATSVSTRGSTTWTHNWPTTANIGAGGAGTNVYAAEVGVDSSYKHFQQSSLDVDTDIYIIEHSVMCANVVYLRDGGVLHRLGRIIIRGGENQAFDDMDKVNMDQFR
jgi:hypothetical protein